MSSQSSVEPRGSNTSLPSSPLQSSPTAPRSLSLSVLNSQPIPQSLPDDSAEPHQSQLPNFARADSTEYRQACVRELAEDEVAYVRELLESFGHQVPKSPPPELQALEEILVERKAHARVRLKSRLENESETELAFLNAAVGESLHRFYLGCYFAWRLRDGKIVASAVRKADLHVQEGAPAA